MLIGKLRKIPQVLSAQLDDMGRTLVYFKARRSSPCWRLAAFHRGFADHRPNAGRLQSSSEDIKIVKRLMDAYFRAKEAEKRAAVPYQVRGEWEHIIKVEYARLLEALHNADPAALLKLLSDFCRNECSRGLSMSSSFIVNLSELGS